MKLKALLKYLYQYHVYGEQNPTISSIEMDSRKVTKGSLFVCIKGYTVDGHDFALEAINRGAAAILAERKVHVKDDIPVIIVKNTKRAMAILADAFYGQPTHKLHLIGVTGTNGKTTTTHMIEKILKEAGKNTGLIGTMYIKIKEKQYDVKNTTPESLTLQSMFKKMIDENVTNAVMEVSSHALHMGRVHGCDFDVAVFTNLSQDHLDYHHTMDEYRNAKGLLFAQLGNAYHHEKPKFAILNGDDLASKYYEHLTSAHIITYGIDAECDIMAKNIKMSATGTMFTLVTPDGTYPVQMKLVGKFNVYNVLAAIAATLVSGISIETILKAVQSLEGVRGRFELVNEGQNFTVIIDYAHTPDSLENVLKTVKQFVDHKIFVVIGCGGDRDPSKRPKMAQVAVKYADVPIFTSDNPRSEDPLAILKDMESGVEGEYFHSIVNREQAIYFAIANAKKGDCIVIAGKGHETYQQIGSETFEFDDKKVAIHAIRELRSKHGKNQEGK
ncbi:UDP-N-acetylmuramoyl-L-alanyl-D-glutamate--2,6-diaminopimelate ligase [Bacillus alveayuensis]|uniref:UDP-N-acetylmuramoyl-L-alanyl-D-glutamate--2, 6-diaminopimelate ligase n=1 Tax=Aeribacillus alveayuensis TaxID=279215 RepID=UPI0005D12844|nr:UDP-N-acetylmuramoyl-L-alanyl-D-glutamate--2,6-diaminopimelate ligase [Bacillus alveayuensis]